MQETTDQFRTAMVISSFIDDSPGIKNNGQPLRLLDVAVMPADFHPDTFIDSSPPLPGPRACTEIRFVQPPYWIERDIYGDARGHGFEDWDKKFGEFVQLLFVGKANELPYCHPATPLPEPPVRWNVPIYARWDWTLTAFRDSLRREPDSFMSDDVVASELLRERIDQAPRTLFESGFGTSLYRSESSANNTIKSSNPHHGAPMMSEWIVSHWIDSGGSSGCNIAITADDVVEIISPRSQMRSRLRMVMHPVPEFRNLVNKQREISRMSVAVRLNVLASREVVVTEIVLLNEVDGNPTPLDHPFEWFGSNDAGRPHREHKIYRSI